MNIHIIPMPAGKYHGSFILMVCAVVLGHYSAAATTQVYPGATWQLKTPAEVGLDSAKLDTFRNYVGGRGCVVRYGYLVYTWGSQSQRTDVASACKPWYSHFLFKAVEDGRIPSLDSKAVDYEPCLSNINAALGYKDRNITFRHMANQISCYGVSENPGTAYDYNDWQMALFFDTLFKNVYGATFSNVDSTVLHPLLTDIMQCQDNPTFMIFGTGNRPGRVGVSVRDFARLGLLYLRNGNWNGQQLISQQHAAMAVTNPLPNSIPRTTAVQAEMCSGQRSIGSTQVPDDQTDHWGSYSFAWWTNGVNRQGQRIWPDAPTDTYGAFGHGAPRAMWVSPSLDMVVSYNDTNLTNDSDWSKTNNAMKLLVEAVQVSEQAPPAPSGSIIVDPDHPAWLKYQAGGPMFMCGPGDPEGFLYHGTRNLDGTRGGDQMTLINKLIGTGANCIYLMALRSHGGDGGSDENPFVDSDINNPLDEDILNQWETWFAAMDDNSIVIYFFFYDDDADPFGKDLPPGGELDSREANFIDIIVGRFKHHKHLIWCVAEEYAEGFTAAHAEKVAERIKLMDTNQHPVAIHQNQSTSFDFNGSPNCDQFAVQWNRDTASELHAGTVAAWNNVSGMINVNMSEFANAGTGAALRQKIWAIALAGGYSMILTMDIASTPLDDLQACGRLVQFMETTRFNEASPADNLARSDTDYVLADPGNVYIAYGDAGTSLGLYVLAGKYRVKWYDPVDGDWVDEGIRTIWTGDTTLTKPPAIGNEAVVYLDFVEEVSSVPADLDNDHDVDQEDFGIFQSCYSGTGQAYGSGCSDADLDGDGDVDLDDFNEFLPCMGGADQPPEC